MLEIFKAILVRVVWSEVRLIPVVQYDGMNPQLNYLIRFNFVLLTQVDNNENCEDERER
jgi:hypothetical protein